MLYSGLKNVSPTEVLRGVFAGTLPTQGSVAGSLGAVRTALDTLQYGDIGKVAGSVTAGVTGSGGESAASSGGLNAKIADAVRKYVGAPYAFGAAGPSKFDCSGLVTWVLHHDLGIDLSQWRAVGLPCSNIHTVTTQFLVTNGAATISRADCSAGDLVCWTGHIGIATSNTTFIAAPHTGANVREEAIWSSPAPTIRRVKG